MGSFIFTSKGALLVLYSRSRKEMALSFKKYGPDVLRSLCDNDLLQLVDLLISKKQWLEERPSQTYPFRAIPFNTPESNLQNSVECEADKKESIPLAAGYSPAILKDVKKLVREILRQYPDGCNMGMIPKLFVEKYGYHLDIGKLGYSKLSLLMQTLPGVRTEYEYIYPLNHGKCDSGKETSILKTQETKLNVVHHASENEFHPHTGDDQKDYQWEDSGPISASNSNETDLELKPRHEAIELKTAIVPNYESDLSDDEFPESGEDHSCVTLSEHGHFVPVDHDICDSSKETSIIKSQETKLNDLGHHPSEDEFSLHSKDDQKDHQWDELGPVSASNSSETTDLELEPRHEAIKLKTAIDPNYEPDLSDDGILESGEYHSCLTQSEYDHSVPADHGICDSGKETSILETHDIKLNDVVHHNSEDDFDDLHSEDGQKDYPLEELGPVSVSNCNKSDLESKPRQEAIELQTVLDPDYEPNLSDDNSSESGGDESCLNQPEEEGELKLIVEDSSLENPDSTYGNQEQEDGINPNKANAEGNVVTDDLNNPPRISIPATISGILLGGYEGNHMPKKNCSFNTEPASPKNKELIEGILKCLKPTDGTKMPN